MGGACSQRHLCLLGDWEYTLEKRSPCAEIQRQEETDMEIHTDKATTETEA